MKKHSFFANRILLLFFLLLFESLFSQIFLINPTADGGFENGNSFAANNWNTAQTGQGREWQVGTAAGAQSPSRAAYVGGNNYNGIGSNKTVHFFRDIAIPAGATNVNLSFYLKQPIVDNTYDYFRVFTTTTANTPQSGTMPGAGYIQRYENTATQYNNFTQITPINLTALAGTTVRLVFTFRSDGANPNANPAVDNISLTYTLPATCPTPAAPTNLQLVAASATSVNGSFTAPATTPSGFMVIRSTSATAPTPANGFTYNTGATFGANYVVRGSNTNDLSTSFADTGLSGNTIYYYYVYSFNNACTGTKPIYSTVLAKSVTTTIAAYCTPSASSTNANAARYYINKVSFIGTLNDFDNPSGFSLAPRGYENWTAAGPVTQIQGEPINIFVSNTGSGSDTRSYYKAWIDLNNDGDFDDTVNGVSEKIYDAGTILQNSTTFGFLIPEDLPPGNYRLRIRISRSISTFGSCGNTTTGEIEDYTIRVLEKCVAKITGITNGVHCGTGEVTMSVATENADFVKWYTTPIGGTPEATTPVNANSSIYSPNLSADKTYYVSAYNSAKNCEYQLRKPVKATVKILPDISFNVSSPEICGATSSLEVSAVGGNQIEYLVDEDFEAGTLGVFTSVKLAGDTSTDNNAHWNNYTSSYQPIFGSWNPVISSGFKGNHFAMSVSDLGTATYKRALELTNPLNTQNFTNLTIKFRVYFSEYYDLAGGTESVVVQGLYNGTWEDLPGLTLTADTGNGNSFATVSNVLDSKYLGRTDVKFRIVYNALFNDGVAVDDVQLYGEKSMLNASFAFSGNSIGIYTDAAGTISYNNGDFVNKVYLKPNAVDIENNESWTITATAMLLNGCSADGEITINNNTKTWNTSSTADWATNNWKPGGTGTPPTADHCVIIKKPVIIGVGTDALAKNIRIETASGATGNLTINGSLKVTDGITNTGAATDFIVKSDANLKQINEDPNINSTSSISVRRKFTWSDNSRKEYNYLASPVYNQNMKTIFGGVASNVPYVLKLNESTNLFVNAATADYAQKGKGFAVKEPTTLFVASGDIANNEAEFKGVPNNGTFTTPITKTVASRGWNLIGNPYPSNLDLQQFYQDNSTKILPEFRFWDNTQNSTYVQYGGAYQGYSYAIYNAESDVGNPAPGGDVNGNNQDPLDPLSTNGDLYQYAKVSQGFLVRASSATVPASADLTYKNTQRVVTAAEGFFGRNEVQKDLYRLQLITPDSLTLTQTILYIPNGLDSVGLEDSKHPSTNASDAFYSFADASKLLINAKAHFQVTDKVLLGNNHFTGGTYTIRAVSKLGVFANGQAIYLKDKQQNIITDLSQGDYSFNAAAGVFSDRFEIIYQPEIVLATDGATKGSLEVYRDTTDFVIRSSDKAIETMELFDASGRFILNQKGNGKELRFSATRLAEGMYVLKTTLKDGEVLTKKIRK